MAVLFFAILIAQIIHLMVYYKTYYGFDSSMNLHTARVKTYLLTFLIGRLAIVLVSGTLYNYQFIACSLLVGIQLVVCIVMIIIIPYASQIISTSVLIGEAFMLLFFILNLTTRIFENQFSQQPEIATVVAWAQVVLFSFNVLTGIIIVVTCIYFDLIANVAATAPKINIF